MGNMSKENIKDGEHWFLRVEPALGYSLIVEQKITRLASLWGMAQHVLGK